MNKREYVTLNMDTQWFSNGPETTAEPGELTEAAEGAFTGQHLIKNAGPRAGAAGVKF